LDFYRGGTLEQISLNGLEYVISVTATTDKIFFRVFNVVLKKSGTRTPRVELEEMGPRIDFAIDRIRFADVDMWKQATRVSKIVKVHSHCFASDCAAFKGQEYY
jgi:ribosome production factor 2